LWADWVAAASEEGINLYKSFTMRHRSNTFRYYALVNVSNAGAITAALYVITGGTATSIASCTLSAANGEYLKISIAGGAITFSQSATQNGSYTSRMSATNTLNQASGDWYLAGGTLDDFGYSTLWSEVSLTDNGTASTATIVGGSADGRLRKNATGTWAACLASTPSDLPGYARLGHHRSYIGSTYYCDRAYLCFDVAALLGATVTAAYLEFICDEYANTGADGSLDIRAYWKDWGTTLNGLDWSSTLGVAASANTTLTGLGTKRIPLTNLPSLLSSNGRLEIVHNREANTPTGSNIFGVMFGEQTVAEYRPRLLVEHTAGNSRFFMMEGEF
jgi:hypothetical protein